MKFIDKRDAKTRDDAYDIVPDACQIVKTTGGWIAFEFIGDYEEWKNQV